MYLLQHGLGVSDDTREKSPQNTLTSTRKITPNQHTTPTQDPKQDIVPVIRVLVL